MRRRLANIAVWSALFALGAYHGINPGNGLVVRGGSRHAGASRAGRRRGRCRRSLWATRLRSAWWFFSVQLIQVAAAADRTSRSAWR